MVFTVGGLFVCLTSWVQCSFGKKFFIGMQLELGSGQVHGKSRNVTTSKAEEVHQLTEVWKTFKLLKIWETYNQVGGVIISYALFVELGDSLCSFWLCSTFTNICTSPFVALHHFGWVAHLETYMYFSFCGATSLCYIYRMKFKVFDEAYVTLIDEVNV